MHAVNTGFVGGVSSPQNSFFGEIGTIFTDTLSKAAPVWAAQSLKLQSTDQLVNPLRAGNPNDRRQINDGLPSTTGTGDFINPALLDLNFGGTRISGLSIIFGAVALLATFFVVRKVL